MASARSLPANGGGDLRTTLPVSNLILDGGLSFDPEGKPLSFLWEKVSGGTVSLTNEKMAKANISGLTDGSYSFRLTVSDGVKIGVDNVNVTVFKDQFTQVETLESEKISITYANKTRKRCSRHRGRGVDAVCRAPNAAARQCLQRDRAQNIYLSEHGAVSDAGAHCRRRGT